MFLRAQMSRSLWQTVQVTTNNNNDNENKAIPDSKQSFFLNNRGRSVALLVTAAFHYIKCISTWSPCLNVRYKFKKNSILSWHHYIDSARWIAEHSWCREYQKKRIRSLPSVHIFRPRESRVSPRETEMKKEMERLGGEFPWQCKVSDPSILE